MFFLCWEKNDQRGWEKCHKAKDIADAFVKGDLETVDKVFCLSGGYNATVLSYEDMLAAVEGKLPIKGSFVRAPRRLFGREIYRRARRRGHVYGRAQA